MTNRCNNNNSCWSIDEYMTDTILDIWIHDVHCCVDFFFNIHFIGKEVETANKWQNQNLKVILDDRKTFSHYSTLWSLAWCLAYILKSEQILYENIHWSLQPSPKNRGRVQADRFDPVYRLTWWLAIALWLLAEDIDSGVKRLRAFLLTAIAVLQTPVPSMWRDGGPLTPVWTVSSITGGEGCIKKKEIFYIEQ